MDDRPQIRRGPAHPIPHPWPQHAEPPRSGLASQRQDDFGARRQSDAVAPSQREGWAPHNNTSGPAFYAPHPYRVEREPEERVRAIARVRNERGAMSAIYLVLLSLTAAFGGLAAYQWERRADVAQYAELISGQNALLAQRIRDLETIRDGLSGVVAQAYERDPSQLLTRLDALQDRWPVSANTDAFVKLWIGAHDRAAPAVPDVPRQRDPVALSSFETAAGPSPKPDDSQPANSAAQIAAPAASPAPAAPEAETTQVARAETDTALRPTDRVPPAATSQAATPAPVAPVASQPHSDVVAPSKPGIVLRAKEETWIQIVDGTEKPLFTKLMKADDIHAAEPSAAKLITGNPTGLDVFVDGMAVPAFNDKGPRRREIAMDPQRLMAGNAELPKRPREVAEVPK